MTFKVQRSKLAGVTNCDDVVKVYARDLADYVARPPGHDPHPAPDAPLIVRKCVGADGEPDYEIIEDLPPPVSPSRLRKNAMILALTSHEAATVDKMSPPGHRRARVTRYRAAIDSKNDKKFVAEYEAEVKSVADLSVRVAEEMSRIEDLPDGEMDAWAMPDLEKKP